MSKKPMPMNAGDIGYVVLHLVAQLCLATANFFESFATFGANRSMRIDVERRKREKQKEMHDEVMYDLSHLDVSDG